MSKTTKNKQTSKQVKKKVTKKRVPNPSGKGGFKENPQNINHSGRPKNEESVTYWLHFFKTLTLTELRKWTRENKKTKRTVAANMALARINNANASLKEFKEVMDRTEGKAPQTLIHEGGFFSTNKLEIVEVKSEHAEIIDEAEAKSEPTK